MTEPSIRVFRYHGLVRLSRRARLKAWWRRWRLTRQYGQHILDTMDECAHAAERAILHDEEHMRDAD